MPPALAPQLHSAQHERMPAHGCTPQPSIPNPMVKVHLDAQVVKGPGWAYVVQLTAVGGLAFAHSPAAASPAAAPSGPSYPRPRQEPAPAVRTSALQSRPASSGVPQLPAEQDGAGQALVADGLPEQMQGEAQPRPEA